MKSIGIVGGGQLGQMMIDAATEMGIRSYCLDPDPLCPCKYNAYELVVGQYDDFNKLEKICKKVDALTYEFENVSGGAIAMLETDYNIPQGSRLLYISQNRIREKDFARSAGFKTANYARVSNNSQLKKAINKIGYPCILKTASGGYDGKGQFLLNSDADLIDIDCEYILEEKINFDYEISCIGARSINNDMVVYPLFKNEHHHGILHRTEFLYNDEFQHEIEKIMLNYMEMLDYRGTLCVELFVRGKEIIFNEMAPRPHNSGHMTIEACNASQYKNHVLGVLGMPLVKPEIIHNCEMVNLLGSDILCADDFAKEKNVVVHSYRKAVIKPLRKMGHVTFVDLDKEQVNDLIKKYLKENQDE